MAEWYGLRDGLTDFSIENDTHAALLFASQDLDATLNKILNKSFRTDTPPKFVLYGDWGVGKTHTMRHIEHVIATTPEFPARTVFVELPDINSKSTFQVAHAALMDALGMDTVKSWMAQYQIKHQAQAMANYSRIRSKWGYRESIYNDYNLWRGGSYRLGLVARTSNLCSRITSRRSTSTARPIITNG